MVLGEMMLIIMVSGFSIIAGLAIVELLIWINGRARQ